MFSLCFSDDRTKIFVVYVAKTYPIILGLFGLLQYPFFKPFPKCLSHNNNSNTYIYIYSVVRSIICDIMKPYYEDEYNKDNSVPI